MAAKKRKRAKGIVLIDAMWAKTTGMGLFLDEQNEDTQVPALLVTVTDFNMEDGSFLEMEFYAPTDKGTEVLITAFVPKQSVIGVLSGEGIERKAGFKVSA